MVTISGSPDPDPAGDLAVFIARLRELRAWAGEPSFRALARTVGPLLKPPQQVAQSTIGDIFQARRRRLDFDLVVGIVRALGVDEAGVARWRAACVAAHANAKAGAPAGVLRQLPPDLATFTGREAVLKLLLDVAAPAGMSRTPTVVVSAIEGMGGVGKTQLAVHLAHELVRSGRFTEAQLYVNLRGFDPVQKPARPEVVLDGFLRQLGVPADRVPDGLDARAAMFRDRMSGREALILLDNAAGEDQIRELIPSDPACLVIVTSRRSLGGLDGATLFALNVFSLAEAVDLLGRVAGEDRIREEPAAAVRIAQACGFLPLAVSLAASKLRTRPTWSLSELADRLSAGGLDAIRAGDRDVRPVFDMSFQALPANGRRLITLLGLFWGDDFGIAEAAALADIGLVQADGLLELFLDEHLLESAAPGRFHFHDLLRAYAREQAGSLPEDTRRAAVDRLTVWYLRTVDNANKALNFAEPPGAPASASTSVEPLAFGSYDEALSWFDQTSESLVGSVRASAVHALHETAWRTAVTLRSYFRLRRRMIEWHQTHSAALASAEVLGDDRARARILNSVGVAHVILHDHESSIRCFQQVLEIFRSLDDPEGQSSAMINLGCAFNDQDRPQEAIAMLDEALILTRRNADYLRTARALINKAHAQSIAGSPREAIGTYQDAENIVRLLGSSHEESIVLGNLGDTHLAVGDAQAALVCYRRALGLRRALDDRPGQAASLLDIGDALSAAGNDVEARMSWEECLTIFEEIKDPRSAQARSRLSGS